MSVETVDICLLSNLNHINCVKCVTVC